MYASIGGSCQYLGANDRMPLGSARSYRLPRSAPWRAWQVHLVLTSTLLLTKGSPPSRLIQLLHLHFHSSNLCLCEVVLRALGVYCLLIRNPDDNYATLVHDFASIDRQPFLTSPMLLDGPSHGHASHTLSSSNTVVALDDPRAELDVVQAEVARVSQTLKALMDKTHVLRARINDMYSPVIRRLPPEITAEIFQACVPVFDMEDTNSNTSIPLQLGSVCSSWRRIAWAAPTLWSSLTLRLNTTNIGTQITLLEEWLHRTGDLPLSLRLCSEEEIHWSSAPTPGTAIEVIRKYASRWKDLDLRLPTSCYKYLPTSDNCLPLLQSLNLNPPGGQGERRHKVDMSNSAKIHHLSLSCVYLISMKFQWVHVTHLRLEAFYVDECLEALRQSPQLEVCLLRNIIGGDDGHALPEAPLILPTLHTLSIENEKDTHIALLLDIIAIPHTTHFSYSGRNLVHLSSLCALILRSAALETITIHQTAIGDDDSFDTLLRAMKGVKKFSFSTSSMQTGHSPLDDNLLRMCNPGLVAPGDECLLPRLESLEYRGPQTFSWPVLLETLESRGPKRLASSGSSTASQTALVQGESGANPSEKAGDDARPDGEPGGPKLAPRRAEVFDWKSLGLNLVLPVGDKPNFPVEHDIHRFGSLTTKWDIQVTSIDQEREITRPLIAL